MAKKEGIRKLFDNIAPDYDKLNHILSMNIDKGWRRKAVKELLDTQEPLNILDVACGTGDFTIEIAQKAPAGSKVTGIDLSEGMMKIGREKIKAAGVDAQMVQGDCEELPYADNTFHFKICRCRLLLCKCCMCSKKSKCASGYAFRPWQQF